MLRKKFPKLIGIKYPNWHIEFAGAAEKPTENIAWAFISISLNIVSHLGPCHILLS
jgi:hypothetical protein